MKIDHQIEWKKVLAVSLFCIFAATICQAKVEVLRDNSNQSTISIEDADHHKLIIEQTAEGDLNGDGEIDLALVAHPNNNGKDNAEAEDLEQGERALVLLFRDPRSKAYSKKIINWKILPSSGDVDSFDRIQISNGVLYLLFQDSPSMGGWWSQSTKLIFKNVQDCLKLIGAEKIELNRATSERTTTSANYLSRKIKKTSDLIFPGRQKAKIEWGNLPGEQNFCIDDFGDGASFDPSIAKEATK